MNIRRKIQSFFEERSKFGLFIAATNLLWPFIVRMPQSIASRLIKRKHKVVFNYLIYGDTYLFKLSWRKTPIDETKGLKTIWSYLNSYTLNSNSHNHDK